MIKKINTILTILVMLFAIPAVTYADNHSNNTVEARANAQANFTSENLDVNSSVDVVSQKDLRDVSNNNGARVRIMQLQRSIDSNIAGAEAIIDQLNSTVNASVDYDKLYEIINSMDVILIELEEFNYNQSSQQMAREFVEYKSDAIVLTKEFRDYIHSITTQKERSELGEVYLNARAEARAEYNQKIREEVKEQNIGYLRGLSNRYGLDTQEIISQIESGEVTVEELKEGLSNLTKSISNNRRAEISQRISEDRTRENIEARERLEEVRERVEERKEQRDEILSQKIQQRRDEIISRLEQREQRIRDSGEIDTRSQEAISRARERVEERLNSLEDRRDNRSNQESSENREEQREERRSAQVETRTNAEIRNSSIDIESGIRVE